MKKTIAEIVKVFKNNIGKTIADVMEEVNVTDEEFMAAFEKLGQSGTPNSNETVITAELIEKIKAL